MDKKLERIRQAEKDVVKSIVDAASQASTSPLKLDYNTWKAYCSQSNIGALSSYELVDTKFGIIKQANFGIVESAINPTKIEIARRARLNTKIMNNKASEASFAERTVESLDKIFANKITPTLFSKSKAPGKMSRQLNLILSDLHFHSLLDSEEVPVRYGPVEEARRLAAIVKQVCQYKEFYRKETQLNVHLLGDIIQNQLYDARDGAPLAEQFSASVYLLVQAIAQLSANFPRVVVRCATGNHGRNTARHQQRATLQKWDSIETMIYYAIKTAVANLHNVTVIIPKMPYFEYDSFGALSFGTHGDTVLNPGYPGNMINVKTLEQQANKISAARKDNKKFSLFFVGHVHTGAVIHTPSAVFITNGALIPTDQYGVSIGLLSNRCGQYMWESVPGHVVGDSRFIEVNEITDKDSSLDSIIKPFLGF